MINLSKFIPVKKEEFFKFLTTAFMMVLILFVYSIQRGCKDSLVISNLGAELISTTKLFGVLPCAIIAMLIYAKLVDVFPNTVVFHILNAFFAGFFLLFAFVLHPNAASLHFDLGWVSEKIPALRYVVIMVESWSISLFYIFSELWGSIMLSLLFWQTSNQIFKTEQAKRLYPLFGFFGQLGLILAGNLTSIFTSKKVLDGIDWQQSLNYINTSAAIACLLLSLTYWVLSNVLVSKEVINGAKKKKKKKISFSEGLKYVFTSKYIGLIATLIICYGISINLVEGVWKKQMGLYFTDISKLSAFTGVLQRYTGIATMLSMIIGAYILKLISWRLAAILTPIMILITGFAFFVFVNFNKHFESVLLPLALAPIVIAVYAGLIQNILSKATKYAFFDATKEMAYIPLDQELKSKGKAAADVIGGRLGKSGGAMIQNLMLILIPGSSLITLAPTLFGIFMVIMIVWLISVTVLSKHYNNAVKTQEEEEKIEKQQENYAPASNTA